MNADWLLIATKTYLEHEIPLLPFLISNRYWEVSRPWGPSAIFSNDLQNDYSDSWSLLISIRDVDGRSTTRLSTDRIIEIDFLLFYFAGHLNRTTSYRLCRCSVSDGKQRYWRQVRVLPSGCLYRRMVNEQFLLVRLASEKKEGSDRVEEHEWAVSIY